MWIKTDELYIDQSEPQLGKIVESEIMLERGDLETMAELVIDHQMNFSGEYPEYITMTDSNSGEDIEILVSEYL